jgi:hypothetical protein
MLGDTGGPVLLTCRRNELGRDSEPTDAQRHDDTLLLFCPTSQTSLRSRSLNFGFCKSLNSLTVSTVHGVVFALFVLRGGYSTAFSLSRCA